MVVVLTPWIWSLLNNNKYCEVTLLQWVCARIGPSPAHFTLDDQNLFIYSYAITFLNMYLDIAM